MLVTPFYSRIHYCCVVHIYSTYKGMIKVL